ncbi:MAG: sulfurtransferase TusA [Candidatus Dasytiphilus stammeri]
MLFFSTNKIQQLIIDSKIILNALGMRCPDTVMMLRKNIRTIQTGENLLLITDDTTTIREIPMFCEFLNHSLINKYIKDIPYYFLIKKGNINIL